jgi:hypothetical protein
MMFALRPPPRRRVHVRAHRRSCHHTHTHAYAHAHTLTFHQTANPFLGRLFVRQELLSFIDDPVPTGRAEFRRATSKLQATARAIHRSCDAYEPATAALPRVSAERRR